MTPILPYRNLLSGGSIPDYDRETPDTGAAERLQQLSLFTAARRDSGRLEREISGGRLMTLGHERHGEAIVSSLDERDLNTLEETRSQLVAAAHGGDRSAYFNALQTSFVQLHFSLNDRSTRSRSAGYVNEFVTLAHEYARFIEESGTLTPAEKFRFLFAASQIGRTMLGRLESEENPLPNTEALATSLRELLGEVYEQLEGHHDALLTAAPAGEHYTSILLQIQMRHALVEGDADTARQRALELAEFYQQHPPPAAQPTDPDLIWAYVADRAMLRDGEFLTLLEGMDMPSPVEDISASINGVSYEILQILASTIDAVNEEPEEQIRSRYLALTAAVTTLSLTRPGLTLRQILQIVSEEGSAESIEHDMQAAGETSESLQNLLNQARGEDEIEDLIANARAAARHVLALSEGAGRPLMEPLLDRNLELNPIARLAQHLEGHADIAAGLRLTTVAENPLPANVQYAIQLLRRGDVAIEQLEAFATAHPGTDVSAIVSLLDEPGTSETAVNGLVEHLLDNFQTDLGSQPDHILAAIQSALQVIAQTDEVAAGVSLNEELRTRARNSDEEIQGFMFQTGRALRHVFWSPSSAASLIGGIVIAELMPALFLARATATGRRTVAGIEVVNNLGRVTFAGHTMTGIGTGLTMSVIGTSIHTYERDQAGLTTHFGRDLAMSAGINTFTFAATVPFSRWYGRWLTRSAAETNAVGRLTGRDRFFYHAGVTLWGTGIALLTNATLRYGMTGEFSISYQEFAENVLSMLAWELGSAGLRRIRQRYGLVREVRGIDPVLPEPDSANPLHYLGQVIGSGWRLRLANTLLRSLGRQRATRVAEVTDRIVREMIARYERNRGPEDPEVTVPEDIRRHRYWDFIARQVALQEIVAPESLDQYHDAFFALYEPEIAGNLGTERLVFRNRRLGFPEFDGIFTPPGARSPRGGGEPPPSSTGTGGETPPPPREPRRRARVAEDTLARPRPEAEPTAVAPAEPSSRMTGWTRAALDAVVSHRDAQGHIEHLRNQILRYIQEDPTPAVHEVPVEFYPDRSILLVAPRDGSTRVVPGNPETAVTLPGIFDPRQMTLRLPPFHGSRAPIELNLQTGTYRALPPLPPPPPNGGSRGPTGSGSPPASGSGEPPALPPSRDGPVAEPRGRLPVQELPAVLPQAFGMPSAGRGPRYTGPSHWSLELMTYLRTHPQLSSIASSLRARLNNVPAAWGNPPRLSVFLNPEQGTFTVSPSTAPEARSSGIQLTGIYHRDRGIFNLTHFEGRGSVLWELSTGSFREMPGEAHPLTAIPAGDATEVSAVPMRERHDVREMPRLEAQTQLGIQPELFVLEPGFMIAAVEANQPGAPRRDSHFFATPQGEVFAFTEVGFDKHTARLGEGVNEDAYGITVDPQGRTVLIAADGMGGYGNGDRASATAVRKVIEAAQRGGAARLSQAFLDAHTAIELENQANRTGAATCATACRVGHDGAVEVAQAGDTMVYVLRRDAGGHRVIRAFLPGNMAGAIRGTGAGDLRSTAAMNASELASTVIGGLGGRGRGTPAVTHVLQNGAPHGIYEGFLTIPSDADPNVRQPLTLRPGDGLLLVSDGIGDIYESAGLERTLRRGGARTQAMGEHLHAETMNLLDLYVRARMAPEGSRLAISDGSFTGHFIDNSGNIYDAQTGGNLIGHVQGDNLVAIIYRHLGLGHLPPRATETASSE